MKNLKLSEDIIENLKIFRTILFAVIISVIIAVAMQWRDVVSRIRNDVKEYKFVVYYPNQNDTLTYYSNVRVYVSVGRGYNEIQSGNSLKLITTAPVKALQ